METAKHRIRRVRQSVGVVQCTQCNHVYLMVGSTPISLAMAGKITTEMRRNSGTIGVGICPNHSRKGIARSE